MQRTNQNRRNAQGERVQLKIGFSFGNWSRETRETFFSRLQSSHERT